MRSFLVGVTAGVALVSSVAGALITVNQSESAPTQSGIWADACVFIVEDAWLQFPDWQYGSIKYVGGFVGNYDGRFLTDYAAQQAISSFDCQRVY